MRIPKTIRKVVIEDAHTRTKKEDQDCMVVMLGPRGNGKSTAAMQMQFEFDNTFNLDRVGWEYNEHRDNLLVKLPAGSGYHADEIRFHTMDFRTSVGVECDKLLTEIRPFNPFTTWTSVRIHKILGTFLEFGHYLFYFYGLGKCVVLRRNDNILKGNAFGIGKEIEKITNPKTFEKFFVRPAKKNGLYIGKFQFPRYTVDFDKNFYKKYKELRLESTRKRFTEKDKSNGITKEQRRHLVVRGKEVDIRHHQLAHMFEKTEVTISKDVKFMKDNVGI
jgi:hypothetical protein